MGYNNQTFQKTNIPMIYLKCNFGNNRFMLSGSKNLSKRGERTEYTWCITYRNAFNGQVFGACTSKNEVIEIITELIGIDNHFLTINFVEEIPYSLSGKVNLRVLENEVSKD